MKDVILTFKFRIFLLVLTFAFQTGNAQVTVSGAAAGSNGTYTKLSAAFTAINGQSQTGNSIVVTITSSPAAETASATLNSGTWSSLTIYPTASGLSISGTIVLPLIDLNGAKNVIIDGRVNQTGGTDLTITNTSTSSTAGTSTIRLINDASNNVIKYCNIKGSTTATSAGIVFFSTTSGTTGNDNNTFDNNNITSSSDANRPVNAIYSLGTASKLNSGNTISNNNIYNFLSKSLASNGIFLEDYNTQWTISNNTIYETASFAPTASVTYYIIRIGYTSGAGSGYTISDNFIGGNSSARTGTWTKTNSASNSMMVIYLKSGTGTASQIQGNSIKNFTYANSSFDGWSSIYLDGTGSVNVGTTSGNLIGSATGNGSITFTGGTGGATFYGIRVYTTGATILNGNTIGGITTANSSSATYCNFQGIYKAFAGNLTVTNNVIGSTDPGTTNSINATSTSTSDQQTVQGMYISASGSITITGNTIAKLRNATTNTTPSLTGFVRGIYIQGGNWTVNNNTLQDFTIANANTSADVCSIIGIDGDQGLSLSGNTLSNFSNTYASFAGQIIGIRYFGLTSVISINGNLMHSFSATGASSTAATIYGFKIDGSATLSNNIVALGGNTKTTIFAIADVGSTGNTNKYLFNTVYIGGAPASSTNKSYAFYSTANANTRDIRNNIFFNARSTTGGSNLHYAIYFNYGTNTNLTLNYNNYFVSGTGGRLGFYNSANVSAIPIITGFDGSSKSQNPSFANAGGTTAVDYLPSNVQLVAQSGTGILTDYAGTTRHTSYPKMGAYDFTLNVMAEATSGSVTYSEYTTLKAAFDAVNSGQHQGKVTITIYKSTTETAGAVLNANGSGSAVYDSVKIYPRVSGLSISGSLGSPLIDFNGAANVTIDGRVNQTGAANLIITNNSTSGFSATSTLRFINDASNNTVKYCYIKGSTLSSISGIIYFATTTGSTGNDNNTISNNYITCAADANRSPSTILSAGTAGKLNSGNVISNNNFSNFFSRNGSSYGIYLNDNNTAWTISGNSFYETGPFVPTAYGNHYVIYIGYLTEGGNGFVISGNYIGGNAPGAEGMWTKTDTYSSSFYGIYLNAVAGPANEIQGNVIRNLSYNNSPSTIAYFYALYLSGAGDFNVGTTTGNIIGNSSGNTSIIFNAPGGPQIVGIYSQASGAVNIRNNLIAGITAYDLGTSGCYFYGIRVYNNGNNTIINNTIGSANGNVPNSINITSPGTDSPQIVVGIEAYRVPNVLISGNMISNLTNAANSSNTTNIGYIKGINLFNITTSTISGNTVRFLTIANANTQSFDYISCTGITTVGGATHTISGNTIYGLSNSYDAFQGSVAGIYVSSTGSSTTISGNFIHSLSVTGVNSVGASLFGINLLANNVLSANNIISLGGNTKSKLYGIYDKNTYGSNNSLYFNTVSISGNAPAGQDNSYALHAAAITGAKNIRNNIFYNARSTPDGLNLHYAAYFGAGTYPNLSLSNNNYYVSGTGGVLGYYNGNPVNTLPLLTNKDSNSTAVNPVFINAAGTTIPSYIIERKLRGISGTGITTDILGVTRKAVPTMGAIDSFLVSSGFVKLQVIPEGLYDIAMNSLRIKDTVQILLANNTSPYAFVDSARATLDSLTFISTAEMSNAAGGTYYIVVRHQNSIETWSRAGGESFTPGDTTHYSFTDSISKAFGNNEVLRGTKYCMFGGDVNQDGVVDYSDMVAIDNASANFIMGYSPYDVNGDGIVDYSDLLLVDNNNANFIGVVKPGNSFKAIPIGQRKLTSSAK